MVKIKFKYVLNWNIVFLVAISFLTVLYPSKGNCNQNVRVIVKIIYASKDKNSIDPRIKNLVKELKSSFRYSSFDLLGQKNLSLTNGQKGQVQLPGGGAMTIVSKGVNGGKAALNVKYLKRKNQIINTDFDFPNGGTAILAKPEYKGGILIFHISASF